MYYVWIAGNNAQLLFIFTTRVSLTTITLRYYSDRLRFYAVPDNFEVWDTPTTGYSSVDIIAVSPGGEPAGSSSVSIIVNYTTMKVLMYKFSSSFYFAVSEVKFFTCEGTSKCLYANYQKYLHSLQYRFNCYMYSNCDLYRINLWHTWSRSHQYY